MSHELRIWMMHLIINEDISRLGMGEMGNEPHFWGDERTDLSWMFCEATQFDGNTRCWDASI
jgi:hypothetical protein